MSGTFNKENDYILPPDFFEIKKQPPDFFEMKKQVILIEVPYCKKSETTSKRFLKKFHELTNDLYEVKIKWTTKKLFASVDKVFILGQRLGATL